MKVRMGIGTGAEGVVTWAEVWGVSLVEVSSPWCWVVGLKGGRSGDGANCLFGGIGLLELVKRGAHRSFGDG